MRDAVFCHLVVPTVNILMLLECLWEVSEALLARGLDRLKSIEGGLVKFKSLFGDLNFRRQASKLKSPRRTCTLLEKRHPADHCFPVTESLRTYRQLN